MGGCNASGYKLCWARAVIRPYKETPYRTLLQSPEDPQDASPILDEQNGQLPWLQERKLSARLCHGSSIANSSETLRLQVTGSLDGLIGQVHLPPHKLGYNSQLALSKPSPAAAVEGCLVTCRAVWAAACALPGCLGCKLSWGP
jgi:hypothetical protein